MIKAVKGRYPRLSLLAWDDMYRFWTYQELMSLRINNLQMFQPCIWAYNGERNDLDQLIPEINLNNLCLEFRQVWVASAFRGAHSPSKTLPDMQRHLNNHKSWMEKLANKEMAISGVIVTGWSRFTHHTVLCELLP